MGLRSVHLLRGLKNLILQEWYSTSCLMSYSWTLNPRDGPESCDVKLRENSGYRWKSSPYGEAQEMARKESTIGDMLYLRACFPSSRKIPPSR